ncbi:MAG: hypothetical protein GXO78_06210 [Calditrichaeota bacterium]|nr:hypothetical protein [Calditrichota bacterium]
MFEFFVILMILALVIGLAKNLGWVIKAGVFLLVLPLKILIGLFTFGLVAFILSMVAIPLLGIFLIPVIPVVLLIMGVVWLLK